MKREDMCYNAKMVIKWVEEKDVDYPTDWIGSVIVNWLYVERFEHPYVDVTLLTCLVEWEDRLGGPISLHFTRPSTSHKWNLQTFDPVADTVSRYDRAMKGV